MARLKTKEIQVTGAVGQRRTRFNPIKNFTPAKYAAALQGLEGGYPRSATMFWDKMMRLDPIISSSSGKRFKDCSRLEWEVIQVNNSPEARRQAVALRFFYETLCVTDLERPDMKGGVSMLVRRGLLCLAHGFSFGELIFQPANATDISIDEEEPGLDGFLSAEIRFWPAWWFENTTGAYRYLKNPWMPAGEEMKEREWVRFFNDTALMEASGSCFAYKFLPIKDWAIFNERFGFPFPHVTTPHKPGSPEHDSVVEMVDGLTAHVGLVTNDTERLTLHKVDGGSAALPFPPFVELMDRYNAITWLGKDLATISREGSSGGVGSMAQSKEGDQLLVDDAKLVSETLNEQVDRAVIKYLFGTNRCLAYFKLIPPSDEDVTQNLAIDSFAINHGIPISLKGWREKNSRPEPEDASDELVAAPEPEPDPNPVLANAYLAPGISVRARDHKTPKLINHTVRRFQKAKEDFLAPIFSRMEEAGKIPNLEVRQAEFRRIQADLPKYLLQVNSAHPLARVLEEALGTALLNGIATGAVQQAGSKTL